MAHLLGEAEVGDAFDVGVAVTQRQSVDLSGAQTEHIRLAAYVVESDLGGCCLARFGEEAVDLGDPTRGPGERVDFDDALHTEFLAQALHTVARGGRGTCAAVREHLAGGTIPT
jgi:hypothetical protein